MRPSFEATSPEASAMRHELYADRSEQTRHLHEMRAIAAEVGRPLAEIMQPYEELLAALRNQARVKDYLPMLVARKVRERYRGAHRS